jgi:hypothetical protein
VNVADNIHLDPIDLRCSPSDLWGFKEWTLGYDDQLRPIASRSSTSCHSKDFEWEDGTSRIKVHHEAFQFCYGLVRLRICKHMFTNAALPATETNNTGTENLIRAFP